MSAVTDPSLQIDPCLQITPGDRLYPVATALEKLTGNRPHPTTTCRWCRKGSGGLLLPSLLVSGKRMVSLEALEQWLRDVTARRDQHSDKAASA